MYDFPPRIFRPHIKLDEIKGNDKTIAEKLLENHMLIVRPDNYIAWTLPVTTDLNDVNKDTIKQVVFTLVGDLN